MLRCTSKYCGPHDETKRLGVDRCVPCNRCHLPLTLRDTTFRWMIDADGEQLECTGDDCGRDIKCSPPFIGYLRVTGHVDRCATDEYPYALSQVKSEQLWP
jgi:hypothetical protein